MDNPDQVDEVIRRNHRLGQALLQVHQHQEMMAVVAVKAVVRANHVDDNKKKEWSDVILWKRFVKYIGCLF